MLRLAAALGLIGLAVATALVIWSGWDQVAAALAHAGWGILWTSLYHILSMIFCVVGWRTLMPGKTRPSNGFMLYVLWLRTAVNNLLPAARIGGEFLAVRVMMKHGMIKTTAVAATIVELTTSVIAVFLFDAVGIGLFTLHVADHNAGAKLLAGLLLSLPPIAAMIAVQRIGLFGLLSRLFNFLFRDRWKKFADNADRLDRAVHAMYRRKKRVAICAAWQFLAWAAGAGEIWLALYFLGHALPLAQCLMLEALIQAAGSAAFAVPGALGVQEAGFLLFGHMLGLAPDIAAATAVIRRCRDVIIYAPGLVAWQIQEGRWLLRPGKT